MSDEPLVLCADDDEDILGLVELQLESAGFRVVTATDGQAAVDVARKQLPTIAILDVMMPRKTGTEVVADLRADVVTRDIKVILLSARVQEADVEKGLESGADAYLSKPFRATELIELVQRLTAS
ncbi:MAG: response regulator [Actinomycetes bacterium]